MGALLNDLLSDGIWKYRVDLGGAFPEEYPEMQERYAGHWIELREPNGEEAMALTQGKQDEILKLVGKCLVDHSFEMTEGKKASNGDVYKLIKTSSALSAYVIEQWVAALPLVKRNAQSASALVEPSSGDTSEK